MKEDMKETEKSAREIIFKDSEEISGIKIEGYDFNKGIDYEKILDSYISTGFQASHFAKSVQIIEKMIKENVTVFLGCSSNLVTSGIRDIIRFLAEKKKIGVFVTTAGGIEEDIIKCLGDFKLGKFSASGELLKEKGVNRTGNIFVPNDRYTYFDKFMQEFFIKIYQQQQGLGKPLCPHELIRELGLAIGKEDSVLYWAARNNIPVFCPGIIDGSLGDLIYFFKQNNPNRSKL